MSYDPNRPQGGASDPYGPPPSDPYGQPSSGVPYNQPSSGQPYNPYDQPASGQPYNQPQSGDPYNQPQSGQPYNPYDQPASGQPYTQPYNPTAPLPPGDPYANPGGQYSAPSTPYGQPAADPYAQPAADPYGYPGAQPGAYPAGPPGGYPGGQPPQKSKTGIIVGGIAAVVVLIIIFCGVSTWLINKNSDKTDTSASSGPSAVSTTGSGTSTTSAPQTPSATPDNRTLVQPAGAPYSFRLPDGFQSVKVPTSDTSTGSSSQYSSAAATSASETNDFLIVDAYALNYDADAVDQTELASQFDKLVTQINQDPSSRQNVTYNGNNGFWYKFDFGTSKAYSYFLFHGSNEIQIRCQWTDQESTIKRGCEDMLSSLQITG